MKHFTNISYVLFTIGALGGIYLQKVPTPMNAVMERSLAPEVAAKDTLEKFVLDDVTRHVSVEVAENRARVEAGEVEILQEKPLDDVALREVASREVASRGLASMDPQMATVTESFSQEEVQIPQPVAEVSVPMEPVERAPSSVSEEPSAPQAKPVVKPDPQQVASVEVQKSSSRKKVHVEMESLADELETALGH